MKLDATRQHEVLAELAPVFVKPNEAGSSLGISKVNDVTALWPAVEGAREDGGSVLVEANLSSRNYQGHPRRVRRTPGASGIEIVTENEFFDYAAIRGQNHEITPAAGERDRPTCNPPHCASTKPCACVARPRGHDDGPGQPARVIEINGVPGFSEASIVPQQAASAGLTSAPW